MQNGQQIEFSSLPIEKWLSPKEVAGHFGLQSWSCYRWINEGIVPEEYIRYCGMWRVRLHPAVTDYLAQKFAEAHA